MENLIHIEDKTDLFIRIEEIYNNIFDDGSTPTHKGNAKIFWHTLQQILPQELSIDKFRTMIHNRKVNARLRELASLGFNRNGTVRVHVRLRKTIQNTHNYVCRLPFATF
jgi:hypothetical protein